MNASLQGIIPDKTEHDVRVIFKVDPVSALMTAGLVVLVLVLHYKFIK